MMLKVSKILEARSYSGKDIPQNFWVVIDLWMGYRTFTDKFEAALIGLREQHLRGVVGISDKKEIWTEFGYRGALLRMPGHATIEANNISRVMYDNPEYLVSKDMAALYRLFNKRPGTEIGRMGTMQNIGNYVLLGMKDVSGNAYNDLKYYGADTELARAYQKDGTNISGLAHLQRYVAEKLKESWLEHYTQPDKLPFTEQDVAEAVRKALYKISQTYKGEGEWLLKDGGLNIPAGSTLTIGVDDQKLAYLKKYEEADEPTKKIIEFFGDQIKDAICYAEQLKRVTTEVPFRVSTHSGQQAEKTHYRLVDERQKRRESL